jgi:hypothetical protein
MLGVTLSESMSRTMLKPYPERNRVREVDSCSNVLSQESSRRDPHPSKRPWRTHAFQPGQAATTLGPLVFS